MTNEEIREFADMLSHAAENFRLPALPGVWPDWMTPEKRRSMADNFDQYSLDIYVMLSRVERGADPDTGLPTAADVRGILATPSLTSNNRGTEP